ncbi:Peptidoglycan/LPS O-acetylase OafA/YrhL, contains acyltransferase and SGNH-hydrolase domains [Lachnospiraceae bacterium XBB2008]|nr:Peptidoglycan/LPS O-acetylase OafA/YrhL, contains acyltransferase and SGNH-hydrolase domains [Lachnospiraceae bacterium XBB2008]
MEKNRTSQLQFLRFAAISLIYAWHATNKSIDCFAHGYMARWNGANSAVVFFIMLSGLLTGYYLCDRKTDDGGGAGGLSTVWTYMKGKLLKFYPLYLAVTLLSVMFSDLPKLITARDFAGARPLIFSLARHLLLVQAWYKTDPFDCFAFSEVGWFLSVIMSLYLLSIPLRKAALKIMASCERESAKLSVRNAFLLVIAASLILLVIYCLLLRNADTEFWEYAFPPARVFEYIAGMSLGVVLGTVRDAGQDAQGTQSEVREKRPSMLYTVLEIASPLLWIVFLFLPLPDWGFRIVNWLIPVVFTLVVYTPGRGYISALFRMRPFVYLGRISFAFYLIHSMILNAWKAGVTPEALETVLGCAFAFAICFVVSVLAASILTRRPG